MRSFNVFTYLTYILVDKKYSAFKHNLKYTKFSKWFLTVVTGSIRLIPIVKPQETWL